VQGTRNRNLGCGCIGCLGQDLSRRARDCCYLYCERTQSTEILAGEDWAWPCIVKVIGSRWPLSLLSDNVVVVSNMTCWLCGFETTEAGHECKSAYLQERSLSNLQ
jgi:hypothetical protein